jgi:hypothetical protein
MNLSGKNNPVCNFWLKFPNFVAKRKMRRRGDVYKKGSTSIKINEANNQPRPIWEISEESYFEPASLCWMDGTLGAWRLPGRLAFFQESMLPFFEQIYH